jgi:hypothetical protein
LELLVLLFDLLPSPPLEILLVLLFDSSPFPLIGAAITVRFPPPLEILLLFDSPPFKILWADTLVHMGPEQECVSCNISTIWATAHKKEPHTKGMYPGEHVFLDILNPVTKVGLMADTAYVFYLILVDTYSRYTCIFGMGNKTTDSVINTLQQYQADHRHAVNYGYLNIECIHADAGTQFASLEFQQYCWTAGIQLLLAVPNKEYQSHLAE